MAAENNRGPLHSGINMVLCSRSCFRPWRILVPEGTAARTNLLAEGHNSANCEQVEPEGDLPPKGGGTLKSKPDHGGH
jgi:hypothetical protein